MTEYRGFESWAELRAFVDASAAANPQPPYYANPAGLHYKWPEDTYPVRIAILRAYKNGKLRVEPTSSNPTFSAGEDELARFLVEK